MIKRNIRFSRSRITVPLSLAATFNSLSVLGQLVVQDPWVLAQQLIELARQGDPAAIQRLAGWGELSQALGTPGVGLSLDQMQLATTGAAALSYDGNGLFTPIGPNLITPDGITAERVQPDYRKFEALIRSAANYLAVQADTEQRRLQLREQIRSTTARIEAALTEAEVSKYKAVLAAQTAELTSFEAERQAASSRVMVQQAINQNAAALHQQARSEDQAAAFRAANDQLTRFLKPDTKPVTIPAPRTVKP